MKKKPVILINGTGRSGKDTFIGFCDEMVPCFNISAVDKVKEAGAILGWNGAKTEKDRKFFSDLKMLSIAYSDHPYQYSTEQIELFQSDPQYALMFLHCREPEEIKRFEELGCITLLVTNSNVGIIESNESDANVLDFKYDHYVDNSRSLKHLEAKAHAFVRLLIKSAE